MQLRCIRAFGNSVPGDTVEVPDGAAFDPCHFETAAGAPAPAPAVPGAEDSTPLPDAAHALEELADQAAKEND